MRKSESKFFYKNWNKFPKFTYYKSVLRMLNAQNCCYVREYFSKVSILFLSKYTCIQTPQNTHLSANTLTSFRTSFFLIFCCFCSILRWLFLSLLLPLFIIQQTFRLAFLFTSLYAFTLRIYGPVCIWVVLCR